MSDFAGQTVLITGAGAGIGQAAALRFAALHARVAVNSFTERHAEETVRRIRNAGGIAMSAAGDVSDEKSAERIVSEVCRAFGSVDVLVNNAGIVLPGTVETLDPAAWDRTMAVNVRSVYLMSRLVLPHMRERGGVIVNVASSVAHRGVSDRAAYTASKGAILALTRAMAADLMRSGIRVNSVSPGTTDTPSLAERLQAFDDPEDARRRFIGRQPMGRLGTAEEVAAAIVFLAVRDAAFITGADLAVDGGMTC